MNNTNNAAVVAVRKLILAAIARKMELANKHLADAVEKQINAAIKVLDRGNVDFARDLVEQALGMCGVTDPAARLADGSL